MSIQKADPDYRRQVLIWLGMAMALALAAIQWGLPVFKGYLLEKHPAEAVKLIISLLYTVLLGFLLVLMPLLGMIKKTLESGRFPPPDSRLIRDMQVLEGDTARQKARQLRFLLLAIIGLLLASTLFAHWILLRLIG